MKITFEVELSGADRELAAKAIGLPGEASAGVLGEVSRQLLESWIEGLRSGV